MEDLTKNIITNGGWFLTSGAIIVFLLWFFLKGFVKKFSEESATLMLQGQKTQIEEAVKSGFAEQLEKLKADLTSSTNRRTVIFNLEKDTIVEFNEALNAWLRIDMSYKNLNYDLANYRQLDSRIEKANAAYQKALMCLTKINLIVDDNSLYGAAHSTFVECEELMKSITVDLEIIQWGLEMQRIEIESFLGPSSEGIPVVGTILENATQKMRDAKEAVKSAQKAYNQKHIRAYQIAVASTLVFAEVAKNYLKEVNQTKSPV